KTSSAPQTIRSHRSLPPLQSQLPMLRLLPRAPHPPNRRSPTCSDPTVSARLPPPAGNNSPPPESSRPASRENNFAADIPLPRRWLKGCPIPCNSTSRSKFHRADRRVAAATQRTFRPARETLRTQSGLQMARAAQHSSPTSHFPPLARPPHSTAYISRSSRNQSPVPDAPPLVSAPDSRDNPRANSGRAPSRTRFPSVSATLPDTRKTDPFPGAPKHRSRPLPESRMPARSPSPPLANSKAAA